MSKEDNLFPEDVLVTDFYDKRNRLDYWFPRLENIGVPVPKTKIIEYNTYDSKPPTIDEDVVIDFIKENNWNRLFIRSMYKSAQLHPSVGSFIHKSSPSVVNETFAELVAQHIMMRMPMGGKIALREWLDLNYCSYEKLDHEHKHEIRFFIKDGEILYHYPSYNELVEDSMSCDGTFSYVEDILVPEPKGYIPWELLSYAETVAEEFTDVSWSVDFVLTTQGNWYCTDMGLNGVYWNERKQQWMNISQHKSGSEYNLVEKYLDKNTSSDNNAEDEIEVEIKELEELMDENE